MSDYLVLRSFTVQEVVANELARQCLLRVDNMLLSLEKSVRFRRQAMRVVNELTIFLRDNDDQSLHNAQRAVSSLLPYL